MRYHDFVDTITKCVKVPAQALLDATAYVAVWRAPYKCRVTALAYLPLVAVTGDNTESRNLNVDLGSTKAEQANLDLTTGNDLVAKTAKTITITATGGYIDLEEGATLLLESELITGGGAGLAIPLGDLLVTFKGM